MKIVVLCGGLSPERDVSISSGTRIAKTLKQNGHQIVLVDMYFGLENWQGSLDDIFDNPPPLNDMLISEQEPDLNEIRSMRRIDTGSDFGDRVIEVCQMADIVFMGLNRSLHSTRYVRPHGGRIAAVRFLLKWCCGI